METKDYNISLSFEVVGCENKDEAKQQFLDVIYRRDFADSAWFVKEKHEVFPEGERIDKDFYERILNAIEVFKNDGYNRFGFANKIESISKENIIRTLDFAQMCILNLDKSEIDYEEKVKAIMTHLKD